MPKFRVGLDTFLIGVRREYRFVLATFAASGIGYLGSAAAPVLVQALIDAGLDHQDAGDLGAIELFTLALATVLIAPYVPMVSHRKLAIGGTLMAALGLAISAFSVDYTPMMVGRIVTGFGSGLAISGANAAVAAREDAERIFAIIWTMGGAVTASLAMGLPGVVEGGDYPLGFGVLVLLCFIGLPCIIWLPPRPVEPAQLATEGVDSTAKVSGSLDPDLKRAFGPLVWMTFAGMFLYSAAEQALWNFAYNIPIEAGWGRSGAGGPDTRLHDHHGSRGRSHRGFARCAVGAGLPNHIGLPAQSQWPLAVHQFCEWIDAAIRIAALGCGFLFRFAVPDWSPRRSRSKGTRRRGFRGCIQFRLRGWARSRGSDSSIHGPRLVDVVHRNLDARLDAAVLASGVPGRP